MLNHITLMGRLTKDPEFRTTGSGIEVCGLTLAVERDFGKDADGKKITDFIDCTAWRNTAVFIHNYFRKGQLAIITGTLQIRNYRDKNDNSRRAAEVVINNIYFGNSTKEKAPAEDAPQGYSDPYEELIDEEDGDLPF